MNTIHLRANQGLVRHKAMFTYVVHLECIVYGFCSVKNDDFGAMSLN